MTTSITTHRSMLSTTTIFWGNPFIIGRLIAKTTTTYFSLVSLCLLLLPAFIARSASAAAAITSPSAITDINPVLRYRLQSDMRERLKLLHDNIDRNMLKQLSTKPKTSVFTSTQKPFSGRNCFFSPIQCQLPVLEISRQAKASAPMYPSHSESHSLNSIRPQQKSSQDESENSSQGFRRRRRQLNNSMFNRDTAIDSDLLPPPSNWPVLLRPTPPRTTSLTNGERSRRYILVGVRKYLPRRRFVLSL
uniref:Uncharacterized protein n=1 Tax=Ditylenchus dipsaci TaxID=166011 RepID=A0A915DTF8_9BILA